jgi:hypothetical protein
MKKRYVVVLDGGDKPWRTLAEFDELAEAQEFARKQEGARIIDTISSLRSKPKPPWP